MTNDYTSVFAAYADVYDALYDEKDYVGECDFLEQVFDRFGRADIRTILDMGCGTGTHALELARRGFQVTGVDRSQAMIEIARRKADHAELADMLQFETADICELKLSQRCDAVISMFAVLSYQTANEALLGAMRSARRHLEPGGVFVFDVWYGHGVLAQRPRERVRIIRTAEERIIRLARPEMDTRKNVVCVHYDLLRLKGDKLLEEIQEKHPMRFLFIPEIESFLDQAGFVLEHLCQAGDLEQPISEATWNVTAVARAV